MDCVRAPCGQRVVKSKTKLQHGTIGQAALEQTLATERPGYGSWIPNVRDKMIDIIESVQEQGSIAKAKDLDDVDRVKQLKLKFMEKMIFRPSKNISLSPDKMSLLVNKKNQKDVEHSPMKYSLDLIQEVRHLTEDEKIFLMYKKKKSNCSTAESILIRFKDSANMAPLVFMATCEAKADGWIKTLNEAIAFLRQLDYNKRHLCWLWEQFKYADKDNSGVLVKKEILQFFRSINLPLTEELEKLYNAYMIDVNTERGLDWSQLKVLYGEMLVPKQISYLFHKSDTVRDNILSISELRKFLLEEQFEEELFFDEKILSVESDADLQTIIDHYSGLKNTNGLNRAAFTQFLRHHGLIIGSDKHREYQDMTRPLTDYYIASSHNTYLKGDQIRGTCTVNAYRDAIEKGCRCVELDCWDDEDNPVIYHGYTPTKASRILFEDVCKAIADLAFLTTNTYDGRYPFIISLENHCSIQNQHKMAQILKEQFGHRLITAQLVEGEGHMPSPLNLMGKVIVKGKKLTNEDDDEGDVSEEDESNDNKHRESIRVKGKKHKKLKLSTELSKIIIYTISRHLKQPFGKDLKDSDFRYISSIKEGKCFSYCQKNGLEYANHTSRELVRIYPDGSRVDSSNYNPVTPWANGCQIVALNYQTECPEMMINQARFRVNGNTGFVLKPRFLRPSKPGQNLNFDPNDLTTWPKENQTPTQFCIKLISGQQVIPLEGNHDGVIDPYVKMRVYGVQSDHYENNSSNEYKSKVISNNGFRY